MRSWAYNCFGVLIGTSWRASGPRWPSLRADSLPMITLFPSQGDFCATALQDCGYLINYDLHWNPTRMVQRAGRIDRLGSSFDILNIYNMFPERALEELLGLVRSLTAKIEVINQTGFLDASVLGEVVTPRDFNTLKRIAAEDNTVIEEQESFLELASSEALFAELQRVLSTEAQRWLTDLDDGIHSGLERRDPKGHVFL